jgi:hypothetical protein
MISEPKGQNEKVQHIAFVTCTHALAGVYINTNRQVPNKYKFNSWVTCSIEI